jgi:hypothetical protein
MRIPATCREVHHVFSKARILSKYERRKAI